MPTLHPTIDFRARLTLGKSPHAERAAEILAASEPTLRLCRGGDDGQSARSWVGGLPRLPDGVAWPTWDPTEPVRRSVAGIERKVAEYAPMTLPGGYIMDPRPSRLAGRDRLLSALSHVPRPLHFLAQIDLGEADPIAASLVDLPSRGVLWVFQDAELIYPRHRQSWRLHFDPDPGPLVERRAPVPVEPFVRAAVSLRPGIRIPFNFGRPLARPDEDGWPAFVLQREIDAEPDDVVEVGTVGNGSRDDGWCQPRVYANATLAEGEDARDRWPQLVEQSRFWNCLLDLASDQDRDPRWLWGDVGGLTYWLSGPDRRGRRFENAWLYLDTT